jgi:hypothetical protein
VRASCSGYGERCKKAIPAAASCGPQKNGPSAGECWRRSGPLMPPAVLVDSVLKASGSRGAAPSSAMSQAGRGSSGTAAITAAKAVPRSQGVVLTDPADVRTEGCTSRSHHTQRQRELRAVDRVMSIDEVL